MPSSQYDAGLSIGISRKNLMFGNQNIFQGPQERLTARKRVRARCNFLQVNQIIFLHVDVKERVGTACAGRCVRRMVGLIGLEPMTPALSRRCSNQLSYRPSGGQMLKISNTENLKFQDFRFWLFSFYQ